MELKFVMGSELSTFYESIKSSATNFSDSILWEMYTRDVFCTFDDIVEYFCVIVTVRELYFRIDRSILRD